MTSWMSVRNWARGALVTAASVLVMSQAEAYTVSLAPAAQTVAQGTMVAIDVVVSDLGTGLGDYNLNLAFDAGLLAFDRAVDAFSLGSSVGLFVTQDPGLLLLTDASFDDPELLRTRQGNDSLTLFTLYFNTLGVGTAALAFEAGGALGDVYGNAVQFLTAGGTVTITEAGGTVPSPGTLPLVLVAGAAAACAMRRRLAPKR